MLNTAMEAARTAGQFLRENVGRVRSIEVKQGQERNLVSEIDKGSERKIIQMIKTRYPDHAILAEESGKSGAGTDCTWIIDPLDGTTNFLHGLPIFSVSIAVEQKGEIVAGVVYDPNRDEMFTAERGSGAFLNGQRLAVSQATALIDSLLVTGFPYDLSTNPWRTIDYFADFLIEAGAVRRLGSAALDLAYVAAGRFDGYWEVSLAPWDMAAGILLVQEAGGRLSNLTGEPQSIYEKSVLASNGRIHDAMLAVLNASPRNIRR